MSLLPDHGRPATSFLRAFTLIELLVVIAIIAVLAGLALPIYGRVKASSQETKCISNLRQIGSGIMLYASDNDGCLPAASLSKESQNTSGDIMWTKQLGPYLPLLTSSVTGRENVVFICPAAKYAGYTTATMSRTYTCSSALFYFSSNSATNYGTGTDPIAKRKLAGLASSSGTILVSEGKLAAGANSGACTSSLSYSTVRTDIGRTTSSQTVNLDFRHSDKINVLYADGHTGNVPFANRTNITQLIWEGRTTN